MHGMMAVMKREFLLRARSKWFLIGTLAAPLIMVGIFAIPIYMEVANEGQERRFAVVDQTGVIAEHLEPRLAEIGYDVTVEPWSDDVVERLSEAVLQDELGSLIVLDQQTLESGVATIHTTSAPSTLRTVLISGAITESAVEASLEGVDVVQLLAGGELSVELLDAETVESEPTEFAAGFIGSMLIYMAVILWAAAVLRATMEEKRDRIAEIIVSSMKPWHLMLGKMLGVGGVGLLQIVIWVAVIGTFMVMGMPSLMEARPEWGFLDNVAEVVPDVGTAILFIGFFLGGYFIYAGFYAAIGAMVNSDEEVQQVQLPVILVYMTPILFLAPIVEEPTSSFATWMSLVPFFSPVLMWPRVVVGAAPAWQIGLSYAGMALAVVGVAWVAGRIYKVGMLMAGKRPTVPELWRWVKEA